MIFPICNGQILTQRTVNLVLKQPFTVTLFSQHGFKDGSRFYLNEVVDDVTVGVNTAQGIPADENDLLESLEIVFPSNPFPPSADCIEFTWKHGFENLGTRRIDILEITDDGERINHHSMFFDVTIASPDHITERLSPRNQWKFQLLRYVVIGETTAVVALVIYILAMSIGNPSISNPLANSPGNDQNLVRISNVQNPQITACPPIECPEPVVCPEQKACEVCNTCPEPKACPEPVVCPEPIACPTCDICPDPVMCPTCKECVTYPKLVACKTTEPKIVVTKPAEPHRPDKTQVRKKNYGPPVVKNGVTYYR